MKNTATYFNGELMNIKYVILESNIPYDWDDYDLWGTVFYDVEKDCISTCKWGHGTGATFDGPKMDLNEAIENGVVTIEHLIEVMVNALPISLEESVRRLAVLSNINNPLSIPVNVIRGRKFRGEGYLVWAEAEPVRYGLGAYQGEKNYYPFIFCPETGDFNKVNSFGYLEFTDDLKNNFKKLIYNSLEKNIDTVSRLAHQWAYNMSYSACDTRTFYDNNTVLGSVALAKLPINDIVKKRCEFEIARREEAAEKKMMEKLPGIIEWVKKNTDKTEEEDIMDLAKHIYHKYNK